MIEKHLPKGLYIATYDIRGTLSNGEQKPTRQTGLVTHTHQLIGGFTELRPDFRLAVTQSTALESSRYSLLTPEGKTADVLGLDSAFSQYLVDPVTGKKDKNRVTHYFEEQIHNPDNPIYKSLAEQYATHIRKANTPNLLLQNSNPLVSVLKAEEFGYLDPVTSGQLNVTGVIHDVEGYRERLKYVKERFGETRINLKLIAISEFVRRQLEELGMPEESIFKVPNGFDVDAFDANMQKVKDENVFEEVKRRNNLPDGQMILVSARRVSHKGHLDVIDAVKSLTEDGKFADAYVAFTGNNMYTTDNMGYEGKIRERIQETGLEDKVFLLDGLTQEEVYSCYDGAHISVLASTEPEGFGYSNIEAMRAGVPVITTELGGPLDYIKDGETGLFVEPHNATSIAHAMDRLLSNPSLYEKIAAEGRKKAKEYTIENMIKGYADTITAGKPRLQLNIDPRREFTRIGGGIYSDVYRYEPEGISSNVVQVFKPEKTDLTIEKVQREYAHLCEGYKDMPGLIPPQRLLLPEGDIVLADTVLMKQEVKSDPERNNLRKRTREDLEEKTLKQLKQFIDITKGLFTSVSQDPKIQQIGSRVPDIIDPELNNLVIDNNAGLRLVDTNKLISTEHLKLLVKTGAKLDIDEKRFHALLLRRLMYLDSKFFGQSQDDLKQDGFYSQYLAQEDFDRLFAMSKEAGEPIA